MCLIVPWLAWVPRSCRYHAGVVICQNPFPAGTTAIRLPLMTRFRYRQVSLPGELWVKFLNTGDKWVEVARTVNVSSTYMTYVNMTFDSLGHRPRSRGLIVLFSPRNLLHFFSLYVYIIIGSVRLYSNDCVYVCGDTPQKMKKNYISLHKFLIDL